MKKILFVAAATMLGLSSCSDNEIFNSVEKSKTPITVNVYQQNQTRAVTETTLTTLQSGFKFVAVSATNPTSSFIEETTVSMQGGKWDYGTTAYWPTNTSEAVKFYGVYPTSGTIDPANDKITISVNNGTEDVVVAYKSQSKTTDGSVSLSFSHILGQVQIYAMGQNGDFNYTITGLTLNTDDVIDYTCATKTTTAATTSTKKDFAFLATGSAIFAPYSGNGSFTSLNGTENANVLALPALPVTLTINYTVASKTNTDSDRLTKSATFTPQAGKLNRINLTLPSSRTAMSFTVEAVDGWDAGTDQAPTLN